MHFYLCNLKILLRSKVKPYLTVQAFHFGTQCQPSAGGKRSELSFWSVYIQGFSPPRDEYPRNLPQNNLQTTVITLRFWLRVSYVWRLLMAVFRNMKIWRSLWVSVVILDALFWRGTHQCHLWSPKFWYGDFLNTRTKDLESLKTKSSSASSDLLNTKIMSAMITMA